MASVNVRIDMRPYTSKIHRVIKDKYVESVSRPGVKTEIYTELYDMIVDTIPQDTGALAYSPLAGGGAEYMGVGKRSKADHYASGDITDKGIYFNPYSIKQKTGETIYYASQVDKFRPYMSINENKEGAYERIKNIIVREMNNG
jgi:hypothetical protein